MQYTFTLTLKHVKHTITSRILLNIWSLQIYYSMCPMGALNQLGSRAKAFLYIPLVE